MLPWPGQIADNMFGLIKTVGPGGWDGVGNISPRREFRSNCARAVGKPRVSGPRAGRLDLCVSLRLTIATLFGSETRRSRLLALTSS